MADCLLLLLQGDMIGGLTCAYTNVIGLWFFALCLAAIEIAVAIKFSNVTLPTVMGMLISILMVNYLPVEMWLVPIGILSVNMAALIYARLFD